MYVIIYCMYFDEIFIYVGDASKLLFFELLFMNSPSLLSIRHNKLQQIGKGKWKLWSNIFNIPDTLIALSSMNNIIRRLDWER